MSDVAISAEGLGKRYLLWNRARPTNLSELGSFAGTAVKRWLHIPHVEPARREIWALRDVSFQVERGKVLGLIGPNGAGKSTLLSILARITEPTEGRAEIRGRVSSLLEVGTGFHPELSGRDNVFLNGAILGMRRSETARMFDQIVEFSGVAPFIDTPVKRYSTGMHMRLAFAVAAHLDPEVLLVDEVLSVGDQAFQAKCLERIEEITRSGKTVVFVSHDLSSVTRLCQRAVLVRQGRIEFDGPIDGAVERYIGERRLLAGGGELSGVEREGTGEVRVAELSVRGADENSVLTPTQPMLIRVRLETLRPVSATNVAVQLTISTIAGVPLTTLSTRVEPTVLRPGIELDSGTTIECGLDEIPLRPGTYLLSVVVDRLEETLDRVVNQVEFTVLPGDYLGTGVPHEAQEGPILVRHAWRVVQPTSPLAP